MNDTPDLTTAVNQVLAHIRPALQMDGGDIELTSIDDDGTVHVRLVGMCHGCPHAAYTMQSYVEREIKRAVPAVTRVVNA